MSDAPSIGTKAEVQRWASNRRAANAVEVRELLRAWSSPARAIQACLELSTLFESLHGWPPAPNPVDWREDVEGWERMARLRRALGR